MKYAILLALGLLVVLSGHCARAGEPPRHWTLVAESLNLRTGEIVGDRSLQEFDTLEECSEAQAGRIERPDDGVLQVYVCRHDNKEESA